MGAAAVRGRETETGWQRWLVAQDRRVEVAIEAGSEVGQESRSVSVGKMCTEQLSEATAA
jgi:hypothetical protein